MNPPRYARIYFTSPARGATGLIEGTRKKLLLAHDNANRTAPAFGKPHVGPVKIGDQETGQDVSCAREMIAVPGLENNRIDKSLFVRDDGECGARSRALQREVDEFAGFELNAGQMSGTWDCEQTQNAMLVAGIGNDLGIDQARIEARARLSVEWSVMTDTIGVRL